jgi:hypothetical protein
VLRTRTLANERGGLESIHIRHVDVEENDSHLTLEEEPQGFGPGADGDDLLAELGQGSQQRQPLGLLVVDDQHPGPSFLERGRGRVHVLSDQPGDRSSTSLLGSFSSR